MTTAKRLTKAQKEDLLSSSAIALSGHYQAVPQPAIDGEISGEEIAAAITEIGNEQVALMELCGDKVKQVLAHVLAGATATITGDLQHGYLRDKANKDHQLDLVTELVSTGLLVLTEYPHHARSMYHLAVSQAGRDILNATVQDVQDGQTF